VVSSQAFLSALKQCREAPLVDYAAATSLKLSVLRAAYAVFQSSPDRVRQAEFQSFIATGGKRLRLSSLLQALRARGAGDRAADAGGPDQPPDASSEAVVQFGEQYREEVSFLNWTQWIADVHLGRAARACADGGMSIGIYRDLAVGCDRSGAETWSEPQSFLKGVSVGAPPDILNPAGQNWGLPPFNPVMLRRQAYRPLRDLIRANMRHAGGLRIDHVMGLQRLYCIPDGRPASEGAYIEYPLDDMLGIIALESHRNRCIVVGEDLGTVPVGFRERLEAANVLSYRVVMFEQTPDGFISPQDYPQKAVAVAGSHDMPTLAGWLAGTDIDLKERLGLYPDAEEVARQRRERERERHALQTLLSGKKAPMTAAEFGDGMHRFLGRTRALLAIAQLDDLLAEADPVNVPGTTDHPNWRRKYNHPLEALSDDHLAWKRLAALSDRHRP
jgi:4-alpha-glucanotransferase